MNDNVMKIALSVGNFYDATVVQTPYMIDVRPAEQVTKLASMVREIINLRWPICTLSYCVRSGDFARDCVRHHDTISIRFTCTKVCKPARPTIWFYSEDTNIENRRLYMNIKDRWKSATGCMIYCAPSASPELFYLTQHGVNSLEISLGSITWPDDSIWITTKLDKTARGIADGIIAYIEEWQVAKEVFEHGYKDL